MDRVLPRILRRKNRIDNIKSCEFQEKLFFYNVYFYGQNNALVLWRLEERIVYFSPSSNCWVKAFFSERENKPVSLAWDPESSDSPGSIKHPFNSRWCIVVILWYGAIKGILIARGYIGISDLGGRLIHSGRQEGTRMCTEAETEKRFYGLEKPPCISVSQHKVALLWKRPFNAQLDSRVEFKIETPVTVSGLNPCRSDECFSELSSV